MAVVEDLKRVAVVGADGERPAAGARNVDGPFHNHGEVVARNAERREGGVRLESRLRAVLLERDRLDVLRHRLLRVFVRRNRGENLVDVCGVVFVHLVGRDRESADRAAHSDGSRDGMPFALADAVLRGVVRRKDCALDVAEAVGNVFHLRREIDPVDYVAVGIGEEEALAAGA